MPAFVSMAFVGAGLPAELKARAIMVGDTIDDMETAWRAGALSCLVADLPPAGAASDGSWEPCKHYVAALDMADLVVETLEEVADIVRGDASAWRSAGARAARERDVHARFR